MRRRELLRNAGGTAAIASTVSLAGCISSITGGSQYNLKDLDIGTSTPPNTNLSNFQDYFIEEIESRTDGELQINSYYSNELGSPSEQFQGVQQGTQFGFVYAWPTFPVAGAPDKFHGLVLPYQYIGKGAYDRKMNDLYWEAPDMMSELNKELAETTNMRFAESGAAMLGRRGMTANKALEELSDFEGLKMRTAEGPMYTAIVEGLGGQAVQVPTQETPQALKTGQIDVNMWPVELLFLTETYQFHDYFHVTNQYIQDVPAALSQDIWASLDESTHEAIEAAAEAASKKQLNELQEMEAGFLDTMKDEGHTILRGGGVDINEEPWKDSVETQVKNDLPAAWEVIQQHQNAVQ